MPDPHPDEPLPRPEPDAPYRDATLPVEVRCEDLLARMTLEEKVAQLTSAWVTHDPASGAVAPSDFGAAFSSDEALDEVLALGVGQLTRPLGSQPIDPASGAALVNALQRHNVEETRLGIPALCHEECLTGLMSQGATSFPSPLNLASTWDPDLVRRVADVIRRQMLAVGARQGLAPVADVARDARWGRVEETFGEDPYLVGTMATAYVEGLQGDSPTTGVVATLKHFAGYSGSEGGRNIAPTHAGRREMEDVFLVPFEMAVRDGGARSVMNGYQDVDGEPPAASRFLLTEVLRDRWDFGGIVVADYGAVGFLHQLHHVAADSGDAAALALRAGLDVELPSPADFPRGIPEALERGRCTIDDVDRAVRRVLRLKLELGLFDDPYVDPAVLADGLETPEDRALAAEVAARSITLLADPQGVLPLVPTGLGRVAVVGPNADDVMALFGNYSYENHVVSTHFPEARDAIEAPTVLAALRARLGADRVVTAPGCEVMSDDRAGIAAAADLARSAHVAVVVVGDRAGHFRMGTVGEGTDTVDLDLPGGQAALVEAVLDTGTPTVVVLLNGRPFALGAVADRAAIVEAWFPGQGGADAVAAVLLGDTDPAGRTPITFSACAGAQPVSYRHTRAARGFPALPEFRPVFPFGHGLSFTTFEYHDLHHPRAIGVDGTLEVRCRVVNTGTRRGTDVVQLYLHDRVASVTRPVRQLAAFARVELDPGSSATVTFEVPSDLLSFTGIDYRRIVEPGEVDVLVGASSRDIRLRGVVELVGEVVGLGSRRRLRSRSEVVVHDGPAGRAPA